MAQVVHKRKSKAAKTVQSLKKGKATVLNASARKAKQQAKKIVGALHEAEQIHQGKRKGKTFDAFLEEL